MYETRNQALTMYTDFFDPIHSSARVRLNPGTSNLVSVYFRAEKPCVTVMENGTVEFSFENCKGKTVAVSGFGGNFPDQKIYLKNDGRGNFKIRIPHFPPGLHYYRWYVDEVAVVHANAGVHFGCFQALNMFEVPEKGVDFYFVKPVEHGKVHMCKYVSSINNHMKQCYVYTPPGYEKNMARKYPVLYLQHGIGGNETNWIWLGKCNFILDNMISTGECEEMIVVMPSGYSFDDQKNDSYEPTDFRVELMQDIIPLVEEEFRTIGKAGSRALAGIAYGAEQSILAMNCFSEYFSALGVFSGFVESIDLLALKGSLLYIGCGSEEGIIKEQQDQFVEDRRHFVELNLQVVREIHEGYHEWHVWRKCLHDYLKLLFKQKQDVSDETEIYISRILHIKRNEVVSPKEGRISDISTSQGSAVFFDPIYKRVRTHVDNDGKRSKKFVDVRKGIDISDDGKVKLSFYAPGAESVTAEIFGKEKRVLFPEKDGSGYFSDTLMKVDVGVHYIQFYMNGVEVINPDAPISFGCYRTMNYLEIPDRQLIEIRKSEMEHGHITMNFYRSNETGREKLCYIYTPPGYKNSESKRYPVLYLQHGSGENELGWIHQGNLAEIADYLIDQKKMEPMIIVMNAGYSHNQGEELHETYLKFARELVMDCMPYVDSQFRTLTGGENRAIAGISMGGLQAQLISFEYPNEFGWLGSFSGGFRIPTDLTNVQGEMREKIERFIMNNKLVYLACADGDDFYQETLNTAKIAEKMGCRVESFWTDGQHDWTFWRRALLEFLPHLWKS